MESARQQTSANAVAVAMAPAINEGQPAMIAVTIAVGEKYELMARLAADFCERHAGLKLRVLGVTEMVKHNVKKPHHLKFKLFSEFPDAETIMFVDADTIFLKPFDVARFQNVAEIVCVRDVWDRNWIKEDADRLGIAPKEYFNSGFFIVNRKHHQVLLKTAEALLGQIPSHFNDQTLMNAARAKLGIPMRQLGKQYNYLAFEDCKEPKTVTLGHLSGIGSRPAESIKRYYQFWSRDRAEKTSAVKRAIHELTGKWFEYHRVGYDCRKLQLAPDGMIDAGRADSEQEWNVTEQDGEIVVWIIGRDQPTCALIRDASLGVWKGRWMKAEQMPVLLVRNVCREGGSPMIRKNTTKSVNARNGRIRKI